MKYDMGGKKILLVNKNGMSEALREILEKQTLPSPEIITASSQEEALPLLDKTVTLLILDVVEVEHHLIIRKLQEINSQDVRVAFLCILPYRVEDERDSESPIWISLADKVIYKPFNIHTLEKSVKDILGCSCSCAA